MERSDPIETPVEATKLKRQTLQLQNAKTWRLLEPCSSSIRNPPKTSSGVTGAIQAGSDFDCEWKIRSNENQRSPGERSMEAMEKKTMRNDCGVTTGSV
ncbi:hypothetical protein ZHAS_00003250 [Anopheles sinensis]|uniref:Uncharacterized protein n=1 Tax=Anopheles sinensis TaxID=74873 RepID=A0A084VDY4_ANOSI|nr:hypothetical protein ZHAS_00003250 [Anopheles sinensis]